MKGRFGKCRNKSIGLEIPATYTFSLKKPSKLNKLHVQESPIKKQGDKAPSMQ